MTEPLREVRCKVCGRLLFKAAGLARVEILCRGCKQTQRIIVSAALQH